MFGEQPSPLVPLEEDERERLQAFLSDGAPGLTRVCVPYPWDLDGVPVTWAELARRSGRPVAEIARGVAAHGRRLRFGAHTAVLTRLDEAPSFSTPEPWLRRLATVLLGDSTTDEVLWCPWNVAQILSSPRPQVPDVFVGDMGVACYRAAVDVFLEDFRDVREWAPPEGVWAAPDLQWVAVHEPGRWGATIACQQLRVDALTRDDEFDLVPAISFPERDVLARIAASGP